MTSYLAFKTRAIYLFFKDFVKLGTYTYVTNISSQYVNIIMIIIPLFLVFFLLLIYFLMKQKEKKVLIYLISTIYYFVCFMLFIFFISVFNNLEYITYNNQTLVLFRDISMVVYYFNYVFLVVAFVRGFGFNIKQFNFQKDLIDLDISEADREEIEVNSGIDYENVGNFFRKRKRNFMYYIMVHYRKS